MKKLFLILIINIQLFSTETTIGTQIIDKITSALIHKKQIKVIAKDEKSLMLIKDSKYIKTVFNCEEADLILTHKNYLTKCKNKMIFTTNYLMFKNLPHAVGAFFYQKGRPNIIFRKNELKKFHITLPKEFDKYIE